MFTRRYCESPHGVAFSLAVAGLRITRSAVLFSPFRILLGNHAYLTIGFCEALVRTTGRPEIEQKLLGMGADQAVDRGCTERTEWHDEAVELTGPVEHPVVSRVTDKHIQTAPAENKVTFGKFRLIRYIVETTISVITATDGLPCCGLHDFHTQS